MTLNFIPDGRSSNMSKIKSKLDQKQVAGGKASEKTEDTKKKGAAPTEGADGEQKLSKKELNKLQI